MKSISQFISQDLPLSGENDWSQWHDVGVMRDQMNRTRIGLLFELSRSDPQLRDTINAIFVEWQSALIERIGNTRGGARLDRAKRTEAAAFIVSVYSGAMTLAKSSQVASPLRSAARVLARWLRERDLVHH